jgi:hypothetical protein
MYKNIDKSISRIPIFIIGCYWGKIVKTKKELSNAWIIYALLIPLLGGFLEYIGYLNLFPWRISSRIWYGLMAIGICILFSLLFSITKLGIVGKLLNLAGTLSLELYLSHIALKGLLKLWCPNYKQWGFLQNCFLYFIVVVVGGFAVSITYHFVESKIKKK